MENSSQDQRSLGVAVVGVAGAVATTTAAGLALLQQGAIDHMGLPLSFLSDESVDSSIEGLPPYESIVCQGWDFRSSSLLDAARDHGILEEEEMKAASDTLAATHPWSGVAVSSSSVQRSGLSSGDHAFRGSHRQAVQKVREDLREFQDGSNLDDLVVVNLASTTPNHDPITDGHSGSLTSIEDFEESLDADDPQIQSSMLYAYASIQEDIPFVNFTPNLSVAIPPLVRLAESQGVPIAGRDGKTGQTFLKTLLAPGFEMRNLRVDGWYSTNILGNNDGASLRDEHSRSSKIKSKRGVLEEILGYSVEDHIVDIRYYPPRGDAKEAWDNIDISGFMGRQMQIKINFLCRDSILAAPLVIELVRLMCLAHRTGEAGIQHQFGTFFKSPISGPSDPVPTHALHKQERFLHGWLDRVLKPST